MIKKIIFLSNFSILFIAFNLAIASQYTVSSKTNISVDFWGEIQYINNTNVPAGFEIGVFDPDGVCCGYFEITTEGYYGFLHVYGDDLSTELIDEGASVGDILAFKIYDPDSEIQYGGPQIRFIPVDSNPTPFWTTNNAISQVHIVIDPNAPPNYLPGDLFHDRDVDGKDLTDLISGFPNDNRFDLNQDGVVNSEDVSIFAENFGKNY